MDIHSVTSVYASSPPSPVGNGSLTEAELDYQAMGNLAYIELLCNKAQAGDVDAQAELQRMIGIETNLENEIKDPNAKQFVQIGLSYLTASPTPATENSYMQFYKIGLGLNVDKWMTNSYPGQPVFHFDPSTASADTYFAYIMSKFADALTSSDPTALDAFLGQTSSQSFLNGAQSISIFLSAYLCKDGIKGSLMADLLNIDATSPDKYPNIASFYNDFTSSSSPIGYQNWQPGSEGVDKDLSDYIKAYLKYYINN